MAPLLKELLRALHFRISGSASVGAEHVPLAHSILVRKVVWKKLEKFSGYPADHAVFSGDQRDPAHDPLIFQGDF